MRPLFILYVSQNDGGANYFIVALLLGAFVMLTIPAISTWIISTSGITNAISQMTMGSAKSHADGQVDRPRLLAAGRAGE